MNHSFTISIFTILILVAPRVCGSTLLLDSFGNGDFVLDQNNPGFTADIGGPIGSQRHSLISSRLSRPGTVLLATLDSATGTLGFEVDGSSSIGSRAHNLYLGYWPGGPFSMLGYGALEFDFASVSGSGFIIVELGSASDIYGPEVPRVPISAAGTVVFPFSALTFGGTGTLESFDGLHITFEAETEQFSFSLNEIRAIPEPSPVFLVGIGVFLVLGRRRRRCQI